MFGCSAMLRGRAAFRAFMLLFVGPYRFAISRDT